MPITVVDGTADALPAPDDSVDAVVASLVLCSVPDPTNALAEIRRVLTPGGHLHFYEHVAADTPGLARAQRILDATSIWPRLGGGCHTSRPTVDSIAAAGFDIIGIRQFARASFPGDPTAPHVIGHARRR